MTARSSSTGNETDFIEMFCGWGTREIVSRAHTTQYFLRVARFCYESFDNRLPRCAQKSTQQQGVVLDDTDESPLTLEADDMQG